MLDQPAGAKWLTSFYLGDGVHLASMDIDDFVVRKENVESDYSGDQIVPITGDSFTVRAIVVEEQDGSLGELSRATVEFSIYRMQDDSLVATYGPIGVILVDGMPGWPRCQLPALCTSRRDSSRRAAGAWTWTTVPTAGAGPGALYLSAGRAGLFRQEQPPRWICGLGRYSRGPG